MSEIFGLYAERRVYQKSGEQRQHWVSNRKHVIIGMVWIIIMIPNSYNSQWIIYSTNLDIFSAHRMSLSRLEYPQYSELTTDFLMQTLCQEELVVNISLWVFFIRY